MPAKDRVEATRIIIKLSVAGRPGSRVMTSSGSICRMSWVHPGVDAETISWPDTIRNRPPVEDYS